MVRNILVLVTVFGAVQFCSITQSLAKIRNFAWVDSHVARGSHPLTGDDYRYLRKQGIKTILSMRNGLTSGPIFIERMVAESFNFNYVNLPVPAFLWVEPSLQRMREIVLTMNNPDLQPIYLHCFLGEDRTSLAIAMYRIHIQGWSPQDAYEEMRRGGFKRAFFIAGLYDFFKKFLAPGSLFGLDTTSTVDSTLIGQ